MACVATCCRRNSALGLRPADKGSIRKDALPFMGFGAQQEPLNCIFLRRIGLRDNLADDRRTIGHLPGRTGEVSADLPPLLVEEICLRTREGPLEEASFSFAGIDLNAVCHDLEQRRGALRGATPVWSALTRKPLMPIKIPTPIAKAILDGTLLNCRISLNNRSRSNLIRYLAGQELAVS